MMRIEIDRAYKPVEVDLWGTVFETVDLTRSGQQKVADIGAKLALIGDDDPDEGIKLLSEMIDLKLKPLAGRGKASTLIRRKWEADKVSLRQIFTVLGDIGRAEQTEQADSLGEFANGRPT